MVDHLDFAPWQYALAFAVPCTGGLLGSRLAPRLVARFGRHRVLLMAGVLRAGWSLGLAFVRPGAAGLALVMVVEFGLITCCAVFNPVFATYRLDRTPAGRVTRTLSAWSATGKATLAAVTALWGLLVEPDRPPHGHRPRRCPPPHHPVPAPPPGPDTGHRPRADSPAARGGRRLTGADRVVSGSAQTAPGTSSVTPFSGEDGSVPYGRVMISRPWPAGSRKYTPRPPSWRLMRRG